MDLLNQLGIKPELLVVQIIGFLILVFLLNRFMFTPLFGIVDKRRADIQATYDQMDQDRARMEEVRREYEQRLAGIEAEAREKIQAAIKEAQTLRDQMLADAHQQAETIVQRGQNESERERQKAFLEMRQDIVNLAVSAAEKVVGDALDAPRHSKIVDDFITNIGRQPNGSGATLGREIAN